MEYLISVGIATRNRQYYAEKVIKQILRLGDNIEICVSDNSDNEDLRSAIERIEKNEQIKYKYTKGRISVVENYNITAEIATGEYYICIGDDDIILPTIFDVVNWMKNNKIDAVKTSRQLSYAWPVKGEYKGKMRVGFFTNDAYLFDAHKSVITLLKNGCQGYLYSDMAGSYHSLVRMEKMNMVKEITGYYFNGFSPDIYSAVCLSLLPNMRCAHFGFPVSIPGHCKASASYRGKKRKAVSSVEDAISNYSKKDYQWDKLVPYYYTPETTWAESAIKAVKMMGRDDLIDDYYCQEHLVNILYKRWVEYRKELLGFLTSDQKQMINIEKNYVNPNILNLDRTFFDKIVSRINGDVRVYWNVEDNMCALRILMKYLNKKRQHKKWLEAISTVLHQ